MHQNLINQLILTNYYKKIKNLEVTLKKYTRIQNGFFSEIGDIRKRHQTGNGVIPYELLLENEKRVFENQHDPWGDTSAYKKINEIYRHCSRIK